MVVVLAGLAIAVAERHDATDHTFTADDALLSAGAGTDPSCGRRQGLEKTRAGILVQDEAPGLDDGREGLETALVASRNAATDQSRMPFARR